MAQETAKTVTPQLSSSAREETIRIRAYELYEQRGREHGHDIEDWLKAEEESVSSRAAAAA